MGFRAFGVYKAYSLQGFRVLGVFDTVLGGISGLWGSWSSGGVDIEAREQVGSEGLGASRNIWNDCLKLRIGLSSGL